MDATFRARCAERAVSACLEYAISGMTAQTPAVTAPSSESALALAHGPIERGPLPPGVIALPRPEAPAQVSTLSPVSPGPTNAVDRFGFVAGTTAVARPVPLGPIQTTRERSIPLPPTTPLVILW